MKHTQFTLRNYAGFAMVVLLIGSVTVGFGAVDLAMVAPKGLDHVAAVGQGELIVTALYALTIGVVDTFSSRLAIAEGQGTTAQRLPVIAAALLVLLAVCQVAGFAFAAGVEPVLDLIGQSSDLNPLVADYVQVRVYSVGPVMLYFAASEALKICGMRNISLAVLVLGFAVSAGLNALFLYTGVSVYFSSPESAVATATVAAQILMTVACLWVFGKQMRQRSGAFGKPAKDALVSEFQAMSRIAPGIGARHLNDYASAVLPLMFIGSLGVQALAAAVVATKIYTVFCRVPQACISGTFVFYGYALGAQKAALSRIAGRCLVYAAVPTVVALALVIAFARDAVNIFGGEGLDLGLAQSLLFAFLLFVPAYVLEKSFGEMLTVHQRGGLLFAASTLATYLLAIPLALYAVYALGSPFIAIASSGIPAIVLALVFWRALRKHWTDSEVRVA